MEGMETLTDYSPTIRAEIEREVARVREDRPYARWVRLGYLTNSHRGRFLYEEGSSVGGLPLFIDRNDPHMFGVR